MNPGRVENKQNQELNRRQMGIMEVDWSGCPRVELIPGKVSGVPLVKGSRVPADTVWESGEMGESAEEIAYNYDLSADDVRFLLGYAAKHASVPTR